MLDRTASIALPPGPLVLAAPVPTLTQRIPAETANQLTHLLGLLLSLAGSLVMLETVWSQTDRLRTVGCVVYLLSLVSLYAASTLSHSFSDPQRRTFYRTLDQVCIFLLTVGSFTPFAATHLRHVWGGGLLAVMWVLAVVGIVVRIWRGDGAVAFLFFALLGWMPALALGDVAAVGGATGLALVLGGGAAYTGGIWFLVNDHRHPYLHAVWHLCTIVGSACHFWFLQWYVASWPLA